MFRKIEDFKELWVVDTEYTARPGGWPEGICLVAHEIRSGVYLRLSGEDLKRGAPAFLAEPRALFISFFAPAELSVLLAAGWELPENVLDLHPEFRSLTNGIRPLSNSLIGALQYFGQDTMADTFKSDMRALAMRGGPYSTAELQALVDYCEEDVLALKRLFIQMEPNLDLPLALIRGRYQKAVARMEHTGIPIDLRALKTIRSNWLHVRRGLIHKLDATFGLYNSYTGKFEYARFERWLSLRDYNWPRTESGRLALDKDTLKEMGKIYPEVERIRHLKNALSQMAFENLSIGSDGRNRTMLSPFSTITGRNQSSTTKFIYSLPKWARSIIQPRPGHSIAQLDYAQQEFGIAAALSDDPAMMSAYQSSDPYIEFAIKAGMVPAGATKKSHSAIRERCKQCVLGVQYSMGADTLAFRIQQSVGHARELLDLHRRTYPKFWAWNDGVLDYGLLHGNLTTTFGWNLNVTPFLKSSTLRNFPVQGNGAEMLRLACCFATESGVTVCAPVHDALLIEAPTPDIETAVAITERAMADASRIVLDGFEIRVDKEIFHSPDRYRAKDEASAEMWATIWDITGGLSSELAKTAEECR